MKPNVTFVVCDTIAGPLGETYLSAPVSRIVASDDFKARGLAEFFSRTAKDAPVTSTTQLREWNSGSVPRGELLDNVNQEPLGGESFIGFQTRVIEEIIPLFKEAKARPDRGTVAVVVGRDVAQLVDGWQKAGCLTDGTVDVQPLVDNDFARNMILKWDGKKWGCFNSRGQEYNKEKTMRDPFIGVVEELGFDWQGLVSNLATTGEGIHKSVEADKAKSKSEAAARVALSASIAADVSWASAEATYEQAPSTAAGVSRDAAARDALKAASALSADGLAKRCEAAQNALKEAAVIAAGSPNDPMKRSRMLAWQRVASGCSADFASGGKGLDKHGGESWLTKRVGGLPTWGWGLVGVGGIAVLIMLAKSFKRKR